MNIIKELNILLEEFKFQPRNLDFRKERKEEIDKQTIKNFEKIVFRNFNVTSGEELYSAVENIIKEKNISIDYGHLLQNSELYISFCMGEDYRNSYRLFLWTSGTVELSKVGGFIGVKRSSISEIENITPKNIKEMLNKIQNNKE